MSGSNSKLQKPHEAICYSFLVDPSSPSHLKLSDKIFDLDYDADVSYSPNRFVQMNMKYSDSDCTASHHLATEFGIDGFYGVFSGSASMSVSHTTDSSNKTVRLDSIGYANVALVSAIGDFNIFPEEKLTDSFKKAVDQLNCEEFSERVGIFYATDIHLGGRINKSYTMQATEYDDETSIKAELEATYGEGCWGVTGTSSSSVTNREKHTDCHMKMEWRAQGGNTALWLGASFDKENSGNNLALEWAKSVDESNAFPIKMTLKPIWKLVEKVDRQKGSELENYLTAKWSRNASAFSPKKFLYVSPPISGHDNNTEMKHRIHDHHQWLLNEKKVARSWQDTWWAGIDSEMYKNSLYAIEKGITVMEATREQLDSKMTVDEFKKGLEDNQIAFDSESDHYWGFNGNASKESNRVNRANRDFIASIRQLCN